MFIFCVIKKCNKKKDVVILCENIMTLSYVYGVFNIDFSCPHELNSVGMDNT